jgi:hypothetical protein
VDAREGAAAEADGADGARGLVVGEGDVGTVGLFFERHLRDERDAHACRDHAEQAAELAAFEHNLRVETRAVAGGESVFAEAVAVSKEQERFGAQILQRNRTAACERVILRESSEERLGEYWKSFEFVAANR